MTSCLGRGSRTDDFECQGGTRDVAGYLVVARFSSSVHIVELVCIAKTISKDLTRSVSEGERCIDSITR